MPAAVAIPAVLGAVGLGGSIYSGITGSSAASKAAAVQKAAADQAGQLVTKSAADVNPAITAAAGLSGAQVTKAAGESGAGVASATDRANSLLDPYRLSGEAANSELQNGLIAGGDFNRTPTAADIKLDPGFLDRLQAGARISDRRAAAGGGVFSGTQAMALNDYAQTQASSEYEKAFERYRSSTQDRFNNLNTVAGRGTQVAGVEGNNLIDSGKYSGDKTYDASKYQGDKTYDASVNTGSRTYDAAKSAGEFLTEGANAEAGGIVGKANAINGAIGSGVNSLAGAGSVYAQLNPLRTASPGLPPATAPRIPGVTIPFAANRTNPAAIYSNNLRRAA